MQKLISKYGLAAHLAIVAVAPLFLSPSAVIWLSVLGLAWLVMEPSRYGGEMLHDARRRVVRKVVRDPLFWVSLALVVIAVIRMLNTGVAMAYDAETGKWSISEPTFPLMPGSVDGRGFKLVGCAVAAFVVMQGCRHCLGRSARGAFALVSSALTGLGAYVWVLLSRDGSESVRAAMECSLTDPAFTGCVYGIFLVLSVVALVASFEASWLKAMPLTFLSVSGNALGLFAFSPAAVSAAHAAVFVIVSLYAFVYLRLRLGRTAEFKFLVFVGMGLTLAVLAAMGLLPGSFTEARTLPFLTGAFVPDGYLETRGVLSEVSARIWKGCPWLGCGYGSFPLAFQFNATPADWQVVTPLQQGMPNGYWLLLVERGVVGAFFLAVPVVLLIVTYLRRLVAGVMLALPHPLAWAALPVAVVAGLETLFDTSFLASGATVALVAVLSVSASAFPKEMSSNG